MKYILDKIANEIKRKFQNKFLKGIVLISGGTAFAQILNILFTPFITRIYSPEEYGVLTLYTSVLGIVIVFSSFFYEAAIPIADDDEKAINVLALCAGLLFLVTLILSLAVFSLKETIVEVFNISVLSDYLILIPIGVLFTGLYKILMRWSLRRKNYKSIFKSKMGQSIMGNFSKLSLGILKFGAFGLIIGRIMDQSAGITILASDFIRKDIYLVKKIKSSKIIWSAKRYIGFLIYSLPNAIILNFSLQMPVFFLTSFYNSEVAGFYGLANSIIKLPSILIGESIGQVFYAEAASIAKTDPQRLKKISDKLLKKLILMSSIPVVILLIWGPMLFKFVFGENWYLAGEFARVLTIGVYANFIFHPISNLYGIYEKQRLKLIIDIIRFLFTIAVFYIAKILNSDAYHTILIYSVVMMLFHFLTYVYAQNIIAQQIRNNERL